MSVKPKSSIRTVKNIRTHSGSMNEATIPYKAYMRISCLEMEKARRLSEKQQAMARVSLIDSRIVEIEAEEQLLKNQIAQIEEGVAFSDSQPQQKKANSRQAGTATVHSDDRCTEGFKINY